MTSRTLQQRLQGHLHESKQRDRAVHAAIKKYWPKVFARTLVVGARSYIAALEIAAIQKFNARDRRYGYNISAGGDSNPMDGNSHDLVARAKIGVASSARTRTPESNAKTSATLKGRPISPERRMKISVATKAAMANPEIRAKVSAGLKGKKRPNSPLRGRKQTPEHIANMRAALTGKKRTPETCERIRLAKLATWTEKRTRSIAPEAQPAQTIIRGFET